MSETQLQRLLRGPFNFLRPEPEDLRLLGVFEEGGLPMPQRIFLEDEASTPVLGFPILQSARVRSLREAAEAYVREEEELELNLLRGYSPDRRTADASWEPYRKLLAEITRNAVGSSFGRRFTSIFWLFHSIAVSRVFKESPMRVRRADLSYGKSQGDKIKYRVFHRYLHRILAVTYEEVTATAKETEENEDELFPAVLNRMRDNLLILTEDHVSSDLAELGSYFSGYLRIDGRSFRQRLAALAEWHVHQIERDPRLAGACHHLASLPPDTDPTELLIRPGYIRFLSTHPSYDPEAFLPEDWLPIWDNLLVKLKEFELFTSLRRYVVPIHEHSAGRLTCSAVSVGQGFTGKSEVGLSDSTRPLDFATPWVVDPLIKRFGLIYDITDFSAVVSTLRRSGSDAQDDSYRRIFSFQRRVNHMAYGYRLRLEKYLGDGAFYSGRHPNLSLAAAIHLQRYYRRALAEGFPFDRGLRIAINYGQYRLLPIEGPGGSGSEHRYEFFGHGIVELSRLATGKTIREIEDIKTLLVSRGYPTGEVERFFAPVSRQQSFVTDRAEESRPFYAYIRTGGALVNEGIVVTEPFVAQLDRWGGYSVLCSAQEGPRRYVAAEIEDGRDNLLAAFRKLGLAKLKGLGEVAVYEVVDCSTWSQAALEPLEGVSLHSALEHLYVATAQGKTHVESGR